MGVFTKLHVVYHTGEGGMASDEIGGIVVVHK